MAGMNVVLGSGPLGTAVINHLADQGAPVRVVNRQGRADVPPGVQVMAADLSDPEQSQRACEDAGVVYHCASPPYHLWAELHPPLMEAAIAGAAAAGAKLVFGDNLYAYGGVEGPITEDLPYRAPGPNGSARTAIAEAVIDSHRRGRVRATIGRGSDFFGPHVRLSAVGEQVFGRVLNRKSAQVLGNPDAPHSVTYIKDFAQALVTLGENDQALGEVWHVPSPPAVPIRQFVDLIGKAAGHPARLRVTPDWVLTLAALRNPTLKAVREQLYQHQSPWVVDSSKFEEAFGWAATPLPDAIGATVAWYREQDARLEAAS